MSTLSRLHKKESLVWVLYIAFFCVFFGPALFSARSLAIADGSIFYHPLFQEPYSLWQHDQMNGFPTYADPQAALWYPLRWLALNYDLFVVSAYVVGATGAYLLALHYGCSVRASFVAGIVFGLSGFMTAHLGHLTIIHAAAWLPLMLLAIERLNEKFTPLSIFIGAVATGCSLLSGHPQISLYCIGFSGALMAWNLAAKARKDQSALVLQAGSYIAILGLGLSLAWIQLGPTMAFATETLRAQMSFSDFHSFSLPSQQIIMMIFPNLYGYQGTAAPVYFGEYNYVELVPYFGMVSFVVIVASIPLRTHPKRLFWTLMAAAAVIYALAEETFVGSIAYQIPILNGFRAPARSVFVLALSAAVLVAMSLTALENRTSPETRTRLTVALTILTVSASLIVVMAIYPSLTQKAEDKGVVVHSITTNPAVLVPLAFGLAAIGCIWIGANRARLGAALVSLLLVAELSWTGYKTEWVLARELPSSTDVDTAIMIADVKARTGRVLAIAGAEGHERALAPISNLEFDVPMVGSYGPFLPEAFANLTGMDTLGRFPVATLNRSVLQSVGASHIVYDDLIEPDLLFNRHCGDAVTPARVEINLRERVRATHLRISSNLGCSVDVPQEAPVLEILARAGEHVISSTMVRAGIDTAEWAIKREDVAAVIRHKMPANTSILPNTDGIGVLSFSDVPLLENGGPVEIDSLQLDFLLDSGAFAIRDLQLVDIATGASTKVSRGFASTWPDGTFEVTGNDGRGHTYARFMPWLGYAWLVDSHVPMPARDAIDTISRERLPDGTVLDLSAIALLSAESDARGSTAYPSVEAPPGKVTPLMRENGKIALAVETHAKRYLVISERYHAGWTAKISDVSQPIVRTNGEFMGLWVPEGKSIVELDFRPRDLTESAKTTLLAMLILLGLVVVDLWHRRRNIEVTNLVRSDSAPCD